LEPPLVTVILETAPVVSVAVAAALIPVDPGQEPRPMEGVMVRVLAEMESYFNTSLLIRM